METLSPHRTQAEVLVVDDDPGFRESLVRVLKEQGWTVQAAPSLAAAKKLLARQSFEVALLDVRLGDGTGFELVEPLREAAGAAQFVFMSAHPDPQILAESSRRGAFEFVEKLDDPRRLVAVLDRAAEKARLLRENAALRAVASPLAATVPLDRLGPAMQAVHEKVVRAAALDVPVLVTGESGTGKEFVARAVHAASSRARNLWLPVNCGAFRPELIDSELFGHEKGAFTGAVDRRPGLVEVARNGTLLLDEIADLPLTAQVSLLRFIELREYRRVGGTEILSTNVRIIAATNRDLPGAVAAGRFREDLYFRLAAVSIRVPPLRERPEDIPVFVDHFLRLRGENRSFSGEVLIELARRTWPGNLRELRNEVDRLIVMGGPERVRPADLAPPATIGSAAPAAGTDRTLAEVERAHIVATLERHAWNRTRAASVLGINPRTLYRKIREFGLTPP